MKREKFTLACRDCLRDYKAKLAQQHTQQHTQQQLIPNAYYCEMCNRYSKREHEFDCVDCQSDIQQIIVLHGQ